MANDSSRELRDLELQLKGRKMGDESMQASIAKTAGDAAMELGKEFGKGAVETLQERLKDADLLKIAADSFMKAMEMPGVLDKLADAVAKRLAKRGTGVESDAPMGPGSAAADEGIGAVPDLQKKLEAITLAETPRADEPGGESSTVKEDDAHKRMDPPDAPINAAGN